MDGDGSDGKERTDTKGMEADSTTYDNNKKSFPNDPFNNLPFSISPSNVMVYKHFIKNSSDKSPEWQIVEKAQAQKLLPDFIQCPSKMAECKVICKTARVVDRVQWVCEGCGKRQPIRTGSFFLRLQCSILQALQIMLAWCEDADYNVAAEHFGVKAKVVTHIYDKMDNLAIKELYNTRLGYENGVVLLEMYPDCLNRLSPDTTDQPHVHRILMMADTKHVPTHYRLHVIKENPKKVIDMCDDDQILKAQLEEVISQYVEPNSTLVIGNSLPNVDGAYTAQKLSQYCDANMQHFLTSRIWRQALSVCAASRDLCAGLGAASYVCAAPVQRYLDTSAYRLRFSDGFYTHILALVADNYTENAPDINISNVIK